MNNAQNIEEKLTNDWLKKNKPNGYFDTVDKKSVDKLIGTTLEYPFKGKIKTETIKKRRTCKIETIVNGEIIIKNINHYFTETTVFTEDEVLLLRVKND